MEIERLEEKLMETRQNCLQAKANLKECCETTKRAEKWLAERREKLKKRVQEEATARAQHQMCQSVYEQARKDFARAVQSQSTECQEK